MSTKPYQIHLDFQLLFYCSKLSTRPVVTLTRVKWLMKYKIKNIHKLCFFFRGTDELLGVMDRVHIVNSTLGKALGGAAGHFYTFVIFVYVYNSLLCDKVLVGCTNHSSIRFYS